MIRSLLRLSPSLAFAFLAACAEGSAGALAPCPAPAADTAGWRREAREGVSLLLPPELRPDAGAGDAGLSASWAAIPTTGAAAPSARVTLERGDTLPQPLARGDESAGLHDRTTCRLSEGMRAATVETAWLDDPLSATGRSYQTVAHWPAAGEEPPTAVLLVTETDSAQRRLLAVVHSVRFR
jgi:hypothetical protein